jgi:hypothetical protein
VVRDIGEERSVDIGSNETGDTYVNKVETLGSLVYEPFHRLETKQEEIMILRRRPHGGHEIFRHRVLIREAEVAKQRQKLSHDQIDHGDSNTRRNSSYECNEFEGVEFSIAEGENSLPN